ncbi:hypothetical protein RB195_025588 [Necator americanus]|uniref:Uncharacterized protein n=1 Tax=Necator americanus TaxID=51031 RepID=A0ABR1ET01_NECAM
MDVASKRFTTLLAAMAHRSASREAEAYTRASGWIEYIEAVPSRAGSGQTRTRTQSNAHVTTIVKQSVTVILTAGFAEV